MNWKTLVISGAALMKVTPLRQRMLAGDSQFDPDAVPESRRKPDKIKPAKAKPILMFLRRLS
jgi:hypothetical protein